MAIERKAFRSMSYGLYIATSADGDHEAGCVVNAVMQATSDPFQIVVTINHDNETCSVIKNSGKFNISILDKQANMEFIGHFGFKTSRDINKFDKFKDYKKYSDNGVPYLTCQANAYFSCEVVQMINVGSHQLFVGEVKESGILSDEDSITYAYYHNVLKGKTPKKASAYIPGVDDNQDSKQVAREEKSDLKDTKSNKDGGKTMYRFKCLCCGHIEEIDQPELPDDYTCPVCGVGKDMFVLIED